MVKRDPDDLISALSKNLKLQHSTAPVIRFTFKRGGLWKPEFAKVHSKKAKNNLNQQIIKQFNENDQKEYPLLVRYKEGAKTKEEQPVRLNALTKLGQS